MTLEANVQRAGHLFRREAGVSRASHVFVVGCSRSGTTLLGRLLGNHSEIFTFHELHFFEDLCNTSDLSSPTAKERALRVLCELFSRQRQGLLVPEREPLGFRKDAASVLNESARSQLTLSEIYVSFLKHETELNQKRIPCEQTPRYVFYIGDILSTLPNARIVNLVRDPRSVALSQKYKWRLHKLAGGTGRPIKRFEKWRAWMNYHPITIARLWASAVVAGSSFSRDDRVLAIKYEDLLKAPEAVIRRICDFLGIDFERTMLEARMEGSSSTLSDASVVGIDSSRLSPWSEGGLSAAEIQLVERYARREMADAGYPLSHLKGSAFAKLGWLAYWPVHLVLALLLNLRRARNLTDAIKRRLGTPKLWNASCDTANERSEQR